ncbi:hypothetical protein SAMN05660464_4194 [Geodermatophilus dictyosporus]|uniref:Uncharacterized protein n=1 Tax=Geodermatophilus dictyosporus TaxID=1523247 RepID=A0A1I5T2E7_9ACTN|nr:hypothetical protein SAMN05660464_4194 [Geodermatophilus dictyosporus]
MPARYCTSSAAAGPTRPGQDDGAAGLTRAIAATTALVGGAAWTTTSLDSWSRPVPGGRLLRVRSAGARAGPGTALVRPPREPPRSSAAATSSCFPRSPSPRAPTAAWRSGAPVTAGERRPRSMLVAAGGRQREVSRVRPGGARQDDPARGPGGGCRPVDGGAGGGAVGWLGTSGGVTEDSRAIALIPVRLRGGGGPPRATAGAARPVVHGDLHVGAQGPAEGGTARSRAVPARNRPWSTPRTATVSGCPTGRCSSGSPLGPLPGSSWSATARTPCDHLLRASPCRTATARAPRAGNQTTHSGDSAGLTEGSLT